MSRNFKKLRHYPVSLVLTGLTAMALILAGTGCAYYNYFYNAKKFYQEGEKSRLNETGSTRRSGSSAYDKCIESAGRMLEYYPDSRWEDDALLLLAKAFYRSGKFRNSIGKVDELLAKYPETPYRSEALLWKGMSLLKVAQPDSARQILSTLLTADTPALLRAQAHYAVGEDFFLAERWEPAMASFRELLALDFNDEWLRSRALLSLGVCLEKLQRYGDAISLYDAILKGKLSRRTKYEATLQRAVALRETHSPAEALKEFEKLGSDAAFQDRLAQVELEAARCEIILNDTLAARTRLARLIEAEKRGLVAAHAQFELGKLIWKTSHNLAEARSALQGVRQADRNSVFADPADSLAREIERLSQLWQRLNYAERQLQLLDSAASGERPLLPADTAFVDSVALTLKSADARNIQGGRDGYRSRDPLQKMVEDAKAAQAKSPEDTAATISIPEGLDSAARADWLATILQRRVEARLDLATYHLLSRGDLDSARFYFNLLLDDELRAEQWATATAALARISRVEGDTASSDSLYNLILQKGVGGRFEARARRVLNLEPVPLKEDSIKARFAAAEALWLAEGKLEPARELYLDIAAEVDTASLFHARALYAAAYLTKRLPGGDTLAPQMFQLVADKFPRTPFERAARDRAQHRQATQESSVKPESSFEPDPVAFEEETFPMTQPPDLDAGRTFTPEEVDEPPALLTSSSMLANFLRSYYPMTAFDETVGGTVEVVFVVHPGGTLSELNVAFVDPEGYGFEDAALKIMEQLRYRAGRFQGREVAVRIKQRLSFNPE